MVSYNINLPKKFLAMFLLYFKPSNHAISSRNPEASRDLMVISRPLLAAAAGRTVGRFANGYCNWCVRDKSGRHS